MESRKINTNMNEKNIFDKLYSTIMENDEDFDMGQLDAGLEDEEGFGGEDEGAGDERAAALHLRDWQLQADNSRRHGGPTRPRAQPHPPRR